MPPLRSRNPPRAFLLAVQQPASHISRDLLGKSGKRFRVAFSFAGEKRDFVAQVAAILSQRFSAKEILYDKYHTPELARSDLAFYLPDLYEKEADLVVAVFCPGYDKKEWCGLEWNAIFGLLKTRKVGEVMLTRFERVEGKGLRGLAGYMDLDGLTADQAADAMLERLATNVGKPKGHYTRGKRRTKSAATATARVSRELPGPDHPIHRCNHPRLECFFGREDELKRIAEALAPDARTWGALIDGPGGMGKTSLAIRAAELTPGGRFARIIFLSSKERAENAAPSPPRSPSSAARRRTTIHLNSFLAICSTPSARKR